MLSDHRGQDKEYRIYTEFTKSLNKQTAIITKTNSNNNKPSGGERMWYPNFHITHKYWLYITLSTYTIYNIYIFNV